MMYGRKQYFRKLNRINFLFIARHAAFRAFFYFVSSLRVFGAQLGRQVFIVWGNNLTVEINSKIV